jgi:O-antigen biosynthesis protein WbqP
MRIDTPKDMPTHLLHNSESYITPIGRLLRKSSLDELPQLLNIIIGDMSIIGPRPALWNQLDLIEERELLNANSVAPGLTGWAQINGRDELEIPIKAQLDGEYVRNVSFKFDLKVFMLTFLVVLRAHGVKEGSNNRIGAESKESIGR